MNKLKYLFILFAIAMSTACSPSPDKFFDTVVLNSNILFDFGSEQFVKNVQASTVEYPDIPSSKRKGDEARQVIQMKIDYVKQTIGKIEALTPPDDEAKAIKEKALKMYRFALPVYEKEYMELAAKCDQKASKEEIYALGEAIAIKYGAGFDEVHSDLYESGKAYAQKHKLNVTFKD